MIIVNCAQGTDEWHELRRERMTASHAQAIASNGKGLDTYINKLMQEKYSSAKPDNYKSKSMQRGNDLESSALFAYEAKTESLVETVGFIIHDDFTGCSPDGIVNKQGLIEIKCLEDKAYFEYLMFEKIDTKYEWQMQMQMLICNKQWCDYVLYNPNFKKSLMIQRVTASEEKHKKINEGLKTGTCKIKWLRSKFDSIL